MSKVPRSKWTKDEIEFDRLVQMSESKVQVARIKGRIELAKLEKRLGKQKLDAMWERIK